MPPQLSDPSLEVSLYAQEPLIQTPIGCAIDPNGRLLVIESQTHFRPKDWTGPSHDQIVALIDTDGDGKADKREVFLDETNLTMDIAAGPDGWMYVSTRNEILRVRDDDGDGRAEKVERKLVWLESDEVYPHNGISGLAFDGKGNLYFGKGENLGAAYTLRGTDSETFSDQGEGGNVWRVTVDGKRLRRIATGFWNPFGVCVDPWGNIFATDNDPSSRPPCRLLHVVDGGDFGFQFRYGRSGLHPFVSWNGQRAGTLPMLAGTGEAPCDVIFYAGLPNDAYRGLDSPWAGSLLVASWVDHRIESYTLLPKDGTFSAERKVLCEGGIDFRPVAMAVAADGALYVTDWVKRDYELHGMGRVWKIQAKAAKPQTVIIAQKPARDDAAALIERIVDGASPSGDEAIRWLSQTEAYPYRAALHRLSREGGLVLGLASSPQGDPRVRVGLLLATRLGVDREGVDKEHLPAPIKQLVERSLRDVDAEVVLAALHWISDDRLQGFVSDVRSLTRAPDVTADTLLAAVTTLQRLESESPSEAELVKRLKGILTDPTTKEIPKKLVLSMLPDAEKNVTVGELMQLFRQAKPSFQSWIANFIGLRGGEESAKTLRSMIFEENHPAEVRAAALLHVVPGAADEDALLKMLGSESRELKRATLTALPGILLGSKEQQMLRSLVDPVLKAKAMRVLGEPFFSADRPKLTDVDGWVRFLENVPGTPDLEHGREVFLSPRLGGCAVCHRASGLGNLAGPDLSTIGSALDVRSIVESLVQPSANVAPQYEAYSITVKGAEPMVAFELSERGGSHRYIDLAGHLVDVKIEDLVRRDRLPVSIMPEGLVMRLTDAEVRDLVVFLASSGGQYTR